MPCGSGASLLYAACLVLDFRKESLHEDIRWFVLQLEAKACGKE